LNAGENDDTDTDYLPSTCEQLSESVTSVSIDNQCSDDDVTSELQDDTGNSGIRVVNEARLHSELC